MIGPMKALFKRLLFGLGIVLCLGALALTVAEIAASALDPALGLLPSIDQVWRVLAPDSHGLALELSATAVWRFVLGLPGWLALGAPGLLLIVLFRERGEALSLEHEQSLFLFDELTRQARADGYDHSDADLQSTGQADFVPADAHYARDDIVDDIRGEHDFLLGDEAQKRKP